MNDHPLAKIEDAFGWRGFPDAIFYKAEHALRFELAGDIEANAVRLVHAMDRARVVVREAFAESQNLTAVVSHYAGERRQNRAARSFRKLKEIGFNEPFGRPDRVFQKTSAISPSTARICAVTGTPRISKSLMIH